MKDIVKVGALYFVTAVSTFAGIGVGLKICDRLCSSKSETKVSKKESE